MSIQLCQNGHKANLKRYRVAKIRFSHALFRSPSQVHDCATISRFFASSLPSPFSGYPLSWLTTWAIPPTTTSTRNQAHCNLLLSFFSFFLSFFVHFLCFFLFLLMDFLSFFLSFFLHQWTLFLFFSANCLCLFVHRLSFFLSSSFFLSFFLLSFYTNELCFILSLRTVFVCLFIDFLSFFLSFFLH